MDRRVVWLWVLIGSTVGGFVPTVWGGSGLGLASLAFGVVGGLAGLWAGLRLTS